MRRTRITKKGQVLIPKEVRDRQMWRPGAELDVVETEGGVLLKVRNPFPRSTLEEIGRIFNYQGPPIPVERLSIESITFDESMDGGSDEFP